MSQSNSMSYKPPLAVWNFADCANTPKGYLCEARSFIKDVRHPNSGLADLEKAIISDMYVLHSQSGIPHDWVLMLILVPSNLSVRMGGLVNVWLRSERRRDLRSQEEKVETGTRQAAFDSVHISVRKDALWPDDGRRVLDWKFLNGEAKGSHLLSILQIVYDEAPIYHATGENCWWFAGAVFGSLKSLGGESMRMEVDPKDGDDVLRRLVTTLGKDTRDSSTRVSKAFLEACGSRRNHRLDLASEAWWNDTAKRASSHDTSPSSDRFASIFGLSSRVSHFGLPRGSSQWRDPAASTGQSAGLAAHLHKLAPTLLQKLLYDTLHRAEYDTFLTVFRLFTIIDGLEKQLQYLFDTCPSTHPTFYWVRPRIFDFIHHWVHGPAFEQGLTRQVHDFVMSLSRRDQALRAHPIVSETLTKLRQSSSPSEAMPNPSSSNETSKCLLIDMKSKDYDRVAATLRDLELELRERELDPVKMLGWYTDWLQSGGRCQTPFSKHSSQVCDWAIDECLSQELVERVQVVGNLIKLSKTLADQKNYAAFESLWNALHSTYISELELTFQRISSQSKRTKMELDNLQKDVAEGIHPIDKALEILEKEIHKVMTGAEGHVTWQTCEALRRIVESFCIRFRLSRAGTDKVWDQFVRSGLSKAAKKTHTFQRRGHERIEEEHDEPQHSTIPTAGSAGPSRAIGHHRVHRFRHRLHEAVLALSK